MTATPAYIRIDEADPLPEISIHAPFRAVLVIDGRYSPEWQDTVSSWLVESGCLYMMAWGPDCASWDDSVDYANIERFESREVPEESFVMTTWHENDSLEEVFWFAEFCAHHPVEELSTLIVHIGTESKRDKMLQLYADALMDDDVD